MEGIDIVFKFHGELCAFVVQSEETKRRELRLRVLATEVVSRLCRHSGCEYTSKLIKIARIIDKKFVERTPDASDAIFLRKIVRILIKKYPCALR